MATRASIRYLSSIEVEQLAQRIWYAPKTKVARIGENEKYTSFPVFGLASKSTEFPMRNGEWASFGKYEVRVEYPMWDIPGKIFVRKAQKES